MVDLKAAIKHVSANVEKLEKALYDFEMVALPRAEEDRKILQRMREQVVKLSALQDRVDRKEPISMDEVHDAVPPQFR